MCAVALVCDLPLVEVTRNVAMLAFEVNDRMLGPFNPTFNLHRKLKTAFLDFFPEDVAEQSNGRLYLSLTKASNKSNMLISEFISKDDLVDAVCASSFVPVMSGLELSTGFSRIFKREKFACTMSGTCINITVCHID